MWDAIATLSGIATRIFIGVMILAVIYYALVGAFYACKWCVQRLNSQRRRQKIFRVNQKIEAAGMHITELENEEREYPRTPRMQNTIREERQATIKRRNAYIDEKANLEKHHSGDDDGQLASPPGLDDPVPESGLASRTVRAST